MAVIIFRVGQKIDVEKRIAICYNEFKDTF